MYEYDFRDWFNKCQEGSLLSLRSSGMAIFAEVDLGDCIEVQEWEVSDLECTDVYGEDLGQHVEYYHVATNVVAV